MQLRRFIAFLLLFPGLVSALNILGLMSGASPSHHNWNRQIFYKLAEKGYNLTIFSADVDKEVTEGVHYIWAEKVYSTIYNGSAGVNILDYLDPTPFTGVQFMYDFGQTGCEGYLSSQGFQTLLNYPDDFRFDLVLVDYTSEPCLIGFLHKFKYPPTVGITAFSLPYYTYEFIGGFRQPSYVPHHHTSFGTNMKFIDRLHNFVCYIYDDYYRKIHYLPKQDAAMKAAFKNPNLPSGVDLLRKITLVLSNTYFAIEQVEPLPPNVIPVGGLQIQEPKPLDEELEKFVQKARKGVVLFSLGTNMKSELMDEARKKMFIEAFRALPDYNFIWKYESDLPYQLPKNVMIRGWVRQNDILAHPKTKAFISHCGLLGTQEAAWYGIPIVGIPFFADQHRNIRKGVNEGTSVKVDFKTISTDSIKEALQEILGNPKYIKNSRRRSELFRDQPEKPIDRAIFWIEWAMRHKDNYASIQLPIRDLGVIVANNYDLIAFFVLLLLLVGMSLVYIVLQVCPKKNGTGQRKLKEH